MINGKVASVFTPIFASFNKKGKALSFFIGDFQYSVERSGQFLVSVNTLC